MRKLQTIEVDKYGPSDKPGCVKHIGMISPQEAFDALEKHLKEVELLPDEYFNSNSYVWKGVKELPEYIRASCDVYWGGSEGIYLDVSLLYRDEGQLQRFNLATGKTLGESGDDFLRMSRIAAECSMMLNGRGEIVKFFDEEKTQNKVSEQELKPLDAVVQEAQAKHNEHITEVVQFLSNIQEDEIADFKKKYSFTPSEVLSDVSFLSRVASEKQRLLSEFPNHFYKGSPYLMKTALHNVCLALQENRQSDRLAELKKMKQEGITDKER